MIDILEWSCAALATVFDHVPERLDPVPDPAGELTAAAHALVRALDETPRVATDADQVRLFINAPGGVPAPPYASWYLDGELLGPSTQFPADAYARHGLEIDASAGAPLDALPVELEFLAFLARHERAARVTGDESALADVLRSRRHFLEHHAALWMPAFVAAVRAGAPGPVFAAAITLLDDWLRVERVRLDVLAGNASKPPLKDRP
jgi:TorA maturation chaperone TorD